MIPTIRSIIEKKKIITAYVDFKDDDGNVEQCVCVQGKDEDEIAEKVEQRMNEFVSRKNSVQKRTENLKSNLNSRFKKISEGL